MFTVTKEAPLIGAAYNKIEYTLENTGYTIGDLFFLEVYSLPTATSVQPNKPAEGGQLLTTLVKNGSGSGVCAFDISSVLQTLFNEYLTLDSSQVLQRDTTAIKGYYVKAGILTFNGTLQVKTYHYTSLERYALRAALTLDEVENLNYYAVDYATPVRFLNNQPDITEVRQEQNSLLTFLLVDDRYKANKKLSLIANKFYKDGTSTVNQTLSTSVISEGGVYTFSVSPKVIEPDAVRRKNLSRFEVYVDFAYDGVINYYNQGYTSGATNGATLTYNLPSCPIGLTQADCEDLQNGYNNGYNTSVATYDEGFNKGMTEFNAGLVSNNTCENRVGAECTAFSNGYSAGYLEASKRADLEQQGYNAGYSAGSTNQVSINTCPVTENQAQCTAYQTGYNNGYTQGKNLYTTNYNNGYTQAQTDSVNKVTKKTSYPSGLTATAGQAWLNGYNAGYYYTSTKSFTAYCQSGYTGNAVTSTMTATGSTQSIADTNALNLATADANSRLVCISDSPTPAMIQAAYNDGYDDGMRDGIKLMYGAGKDNIYVSVEEQDAYDNGYDVGYDNGSSN